VWEDYTSDQFVDNVTSFRNLRFTNNGMVFAIAVVPKDADIPKPESAATLADLGVIGGSTVTTTTVPTDGTTGDTTADTTPASSTTGG
jgi:hypothetical protein